MKKKPRPPLRTSKRNKLVSSNDDCPAEEENFIAPSSSEIVLESALEVHHLTLPQRSQSLLTFLNEDRSRQKFCDLSVSVGGKIFQAHKVVLAHGSSYFHAELSKNPTTTQVTLDHVDDCVFQHLLSFLYASECLVTEKDLPALTEAARFLDMTELLKMLCGEAAAQPQSLSQDQAEIQKSPETEMISTISPAGGQSPMEDIRQDIFENSTESSSGDHHRDAAQEDSLPEKVDTAGRKMPGRRRSSRTRRIPGKYQRADRKDTVSSPEENTKVLSSVVQDEARVEEAEEPAAENLMAREDVNPVAGEQRVDADVVEDEGGDIIEVVLSQEKIDEVCAAEKGSQDVESKKSEGDGVEKPEMCGRAAGNSVKSPTYPEGLAPVITYTSSRKTLKCPKCDKVFDRAGKYESHTRVHTGEKPFQCDICFQCYSTKSNLTVHKKKHTSDTPCQKKEHKCPFCNKLHASKKTLAKHVRRFHPDNIQEFFSPKKKKSEGWKCAACGKTFTRRPHLQEHMILHSQDRPFKCSYCDEHFKSRFARLKHHEKHHLGPFPCEICGRQFNDTGNRKRHIECTHGGKRKWTCFVCGKSVRERTTLREHMRIHSGEKPHLCSICGQSFRHGSSYRLHLRVHHDDKRYECDECGKTFIRHDHLTKHKKIHSGEKAHQCEECGKCFRRQDHLTVHYKSIHLGVKVWQKYKTAVHQCEVCKKEFKGKSSLEMHFRTHSGEKPHRCPECHQTFRIKKTLTKHMVIHSDARPFNCPHCSATFKRKDKLKYHVDHVHSNRITDQPAASHAEDKTVSVPFHENPKIYRTESKTALQSSPPPLNICVPVTLVPVQISGSAQGDINSPAGSSLSSPAQSVVNLQSQGQQQQNSAYQTTTELAFLEKYTLTPQPTNIIHPVRPDQMLDPREPSYLGTLLGLDSAPSVRNTD